MNENNSFLDILETIEQTTEARINKDLLDAAKASGDETAYNLIKLLNEFGIYGLNVTKFIVKLGLLTDLSNNLNGGKEDDKT